MAKEKWTPEEIKTLTRLLEKVKADNGWWPTEECMRAAHGAMSAWAPELVIVKTRRRFLRKRYDEIFLSVYEGGLKEYRNKWHIPGGYVSITDESIRAACSRIAPRELGVDVDFIHVFPQPYLWGSGEHPYGRPLSLYCLVRPKRKITETPSRRFFGRGELPDNLLEVHRRFIDQFIFP